MSESQIIEITDYIFAEPKATRKMVLAHFGTKWNGVPKETLKKWYYKALNRSKNRIGMAEKAKDEVLVAEAKEAIKKAILSRDESLEILSAIARGNAREIKKVEQMFIPSDSERTRAITVLADIQGWKAPIKSDINVKQPVLKIITESEDLKKEIEKL